MRIRFIWSVRAFRTVYRERLGYIIIFYHIGASRKPFTLSCIFNFSQIALHRFVYVLCIYVCVFVSYSALFFASFFSFLSSILCNWYWWKEIGTLWLPTVFPSNGKTNGYITLYLSCLLHITHLARLGRHYNPRKRWRHDITLTIFAFSLFLIRLLYAVAKYYKLWLHGIWCTIRQLQTGKNGNKTKHKNGKNVIDRAQIGNAIYSIHAK